MGKAGRGRVVPAIVVAAINLFAATLGAPVRADSSMLDSLAKSVGLAPSEADPPDFVKKSRPQSAPASLPVFDAVDEPPSTVKSAAELKAMDADLTQEGRKHDALRAGFAPSAKAVAQARRDKHRKPGAGGSGK